MNKAKKKGPKASGYRYFETTINKISKWKFERDFSVILRFDGISFQILNYSELVFQSEEEMLGGLDVAILEEITKEKVEEYIMKEANDFMQSAKMLIKDL